MIEIVQSHLMTILAGAVITSALLGFAAHESSAATDLEVLALIDGIAAEIAGMRCDAAHRGGNISLASRLSALPPEVASVLLFPTHLRAQFEDGHARTSIEFPALPIGAAQGLKDAAFLRFGWDPLLERCAVEAA